MSDEDDSMCRPNSYGVNEENFHDQNNSYPRNVGKSYVDDYNNEGEDEEEEEEDVNDDNGGGGGDDDGGDGVQRIGKDDYKGGDEDNTTDDDTDDDGGGGGLERLRKKRKLKTLMSSYEFAPRLPASSSVASAPKPSYGGRNPLMDWTEHETSILLDAWGKRYLKQGRKSLRSKEWHEVSEKVSQESQIERTDTQCRNRLDTLKKKYKKEKMKLGENGDNVACKWSYFKKMDMLLSSLPQQADLPCGMESGEYVFANPAVYLNQSNGLDEMRDSPGNSESGGGGEDESEGLPPQRGQLKGNAASFKMLADSIHKFSEIYTKIEDSKRQQMVELEKMRMDFHRDLDFEKRQILERAQAEIRKIGQGDDDAAAADDDDNEASAENASG